MNGVGTAHPLEQNGCVDRSRIRTLTPPPRCDSATGSHCTGGVRERTASITRYSCILGGYAPKRGAAKISWTSVLIPLEQHALSPPRVILSRTKFTVTLTLA